MYKIFLGKGWQFPVAAGSDGALEVAEYEESVRQSIWIILGTAKGERIMRPDFGCGIYETVFGVNSSTAASAMSVSPPSGPVSCCASGPARRCRSTASSSRAAARSMKR